MARPRSVRHGAVLLAIAIAFALLGGARPARASEMDFSRRNRCYPLAWSLYDWTVPPAFAQRGPLGVALAATDGGMTRQACARSEAGIAGQARSVDDAAVQAFGRYELAPYEALGLGVEARRSPGSDVALGNTTLAFTHQLPIDALGSIAALSARALVPTSSVAGRAGGEIGLAAAHLTSGMGWLELHAYAGADVVIPALVIEPSARAEAHGIVVGGAQMHAYREFFAFVFDVHARIGTTNAVIPAGGLRLQLGRLDVELGGGYAFAATPERGTQVFVRLDVLATQESDSILH